MQAAVTPYHSVDGIERCPECHIRSRDLVSDLPRPILDGLQEIKQLRTFRHGEVLFAEDTAPHSVIFLDEGRVKLSAKGIGVIKIARAGDVLGLGAALAQTSHRATGIALDDCVTSVITRRNMVRFARRHAAFLTRIVECLEGPAHALPPQSAIVMPAQALTTIADFILRGCETLGERTEEGLRIHLDRSLADLAHTLSMRPDKLQRLIDELEARRILYIDQSALTILNNQAASSALNQIADVVARQFAQGEPS